MLNTSGILKATLGQGPWSYFESGGAENTSSSVTLYNFQKSGGLKPPQPLPLRGPCRVEGDIGKNPWRGNLKLFLAKISTK